MPLPDQVAELEPPSRARAALDFQQVFQAHAGFVWRTLRYLGVPERELEDASQEVFLVVHRRIADFEQRSALTTWLYSIASNVAGNFRTRAHHRREVVSETIPERAQSAPQLEQVAQAEARKLLTALVGVLDADKRNVFILADIQQLPMAQVAEAAGCAIQTAYSRLYSARKQLASELRRRQLGRKTHGG